MNRPSVLRLTTIALAVAAAGCASTMDGNTTTRSSAVQLASTPIAATPDSEFPPNAKLGECYARVYVPRVYKAEQETVLKRAASQKVEVTPAQYEESEERLLVRPASFRIEEVPATFEKVSEQVMVSPGYMTWKYGQGSPGQLTKVDDATGDVMCLVEVPPVYKAVTKEVLKTPATTRKVEVPAEYATVKRQAVKTPAVMREVQVPADYQTIERQVLVSEARQEWRQILCSTNSTPQTISKIQAALKTAGFNPGRDDGAVTEQTFTALNQYQKAKSLPVDEGRYINVATVKSLGVSSD